MSRTAACLLATCLVAVGTASARAEPVTITLWNGFAASETAQLSKMIDKYWAPTHPDIKVVVSGEKNGPAILTAMSGGDPPDVVMSPDSESAALWFHNGAVEDLTEFVTPFKAQLEQAVVPAALQWGRQGATWFALPFVDYNWALFYNKTMFKAAGLDPEHPPATTAELAEDARKLTRLEGGNIVQLGWLPVHDEWGVIGVGLVFGAKFTDAEGNPTLDSPQLVRALEWDSGIARDIGLEKVAAFTSGFTHGDNPFQLGKAAMTFDGSWQSVMLKSGNASLDFGVAPMPADAPTFAGANNVGSNPIVIPRGAAHKPQALEFAKFMALNGDIAAEFSNVIANIPHVKDRLDSFATDPKVQLLARLSNGPTATAWAPVPYARRYADELASDVGEIYNRGAPVADVLHKSQAVMLDEAKSYK